MPYHTTIVHILKINLFRFHLEYICVTSCETKIPMKIRTVSIIFWKKIAHSYSSKRNSYLYPQRFSPPLKKMLTEGNADSSLQILKAVGCFRF
jgi:hypothetical protein